VSKLDGSRSLTEKRLQTWLRRLLRLTHSRVADVLAGPSQRPEMRPLSGRKDCRSAAGPQAERPACSLQGRVGSRRSHNKLVTVQYPNRTR
jgi:hypothetical protein